VSELLPADQQHCTHGFYLPAGCLYCAQKEIERLERALTETHDAWTAETTKRLQMQRVLRNLLKEYCIHTKQDVTGFDPEIVVREARDALGWPQWIAWAASTDTRTTKP
jgi:hypothetical protein